MIIETGVEIPEAGLVGKEKYPFGRMEVGQSIFLDGMNSMSSACVSARQIAKRQGKKFVTRKMDGGVRIWRTE